MQNENPEEVVIETPTEVIETPEAPAEVVEEATPEVIETPAE